MYKFRTLRPGAEQLIGAQLLNGSMDLTTAVGKWLRATRLDELPQLFNILKGDMAFLGPRPERPSVYEAHCRNIQGYDYRFASKPGLVGYAQVFTPHGTPKPIRAKVDNLLAGRKRTRVEQLGFVLYTGCLVGMTTLRRLGESVTRGATVLRGRDASCLRKLCRKEPADATARLHRNPGQWPAEPQTVTLLDINEKALRIRSLRPLAEAPDGEVELRIELPARGARRRIRTARCRGITSQVRPSAHGVDYVLLYEAMTLLSDYTVQQYFLRSSIACPLRSGALSRPRKRRRPSRAYSRNAWR